MCGLVSRWTGLREKRNLMLIEDALWHANTPSVEKKVGRNASGRVRLMQASVATPVCINQILLAAMQWASKVLAAPESPSSERIPISISRLAQGSSRAINWTFMVFA